MRIVSLGITIVTLLVVPYAPTQAETCTGRAQICVDKWHAPQAACFDSFRLAACEKTGRYVAPNGNVWPVSRAQKDSH
jgi:hypothetical protein